MTRTLTFEHILTPHGVEYGKRILLDETGVITAIEDAGDEAPDGFMALPGMPNAHSHAFQRAMTGYGERPTGRDSFWSWREAMYRLANTITPQDMLAIARQAYADMLRAGYTSVAEFHYLHHLPDGRESPEMARAVIQAAADTGIRLVLMPAFYFSGGFRKKVQGGQKRFAFESISEFGRLLESLRDVPLGIAPHSLRAVPPEMLAELVQVSRSVAGDNIPIHIHVSEQELEVEECREHFGLTPISLLADSVSLDSRWNLVHATHATADEMSLMRNADVNVVLCPLTEAYLGDGVFDTAHYFRGGGRIAIGSDSNTRIDVVEEIRLLEYGQRLTKRRRSLLADVDGLGSPLWRHLAETGGRALGMQCGAIAPGYPCDLVVLDELSSPISGVAGDTVLDALIIGGDSRNFAAVYVGGERRVESGVIEGTTSGSADFAAVLHKLNL